MSDEATTTGKSYLTPFNIVAGIIVIVGRKHLLELLWPLLRELG